MVEMFRIDIGNDRNFGGADCSGLVCKAWSLTRWTPYRVNYHGPYSTGHLIQTPGAYWDEVDRSDLLYGDAIVYRYDTSSGHTYIYLSGDGWGEHEVYEARGSAYGILHRWRTVPSGMYDEKGIRRDRLIENLFEVCPGSESHFGLLGASFHPAAGDARIVRRSLAPLATAERGARCH